MSFQTLKGTKQGHIYHIELNRPEQLNAMSYLLFKELQLIHDEINKQDDVRVVVVTGAGKHFCVGLDLKEAPSLFEFSDDLDQARKSIRLYDLIKDWQKSMNILQSLKVPVIVGVHGYCLGGGIDFITSGDIRYCSEDAKFSIKEIDIGMSPDIGTLQRLGQQNSNSSLFRELLFTGRFFTAQEALQLGLVSKIVKDVKAEVFKLAEIIASKSPVGIYAIKNVLKREHNVDDHLDVMARTNMSLIFSNDVMEAIRANMTKTQAKFPKL